MKTLALSLALLATSSYALDIKGLEVDKPVDCDRISALDIRPGQFAPACKNGLDMWFHEISFLGGKATMIPRQGNGILLSITVMNFSFDDALLALTEKFGPPVIEESIVSNAMGAKFEQIEATWTQGSTQLILSKHGSTLNKPVLRLDGAAAFEHWMKTRKEKAKKNAGNL